MSGDASYVAAFSSKLLTTVLLLTACGDDIRRLQQERQHVRDLLDQARSIAQTQGCTGADQCSSMPAGHKTCGGPSTYIVYCTITTDESALMARSRAFTAAQQEYSERYNLASDCNVVPPPALGFDRDGNCVAICGRPEERVEIDCPPGYICTFSPDAACPSRVPYQGVCTVLPFCEAAGARLVCGCDGRTYANECEMATSRATKRHDGRCVAP